MNINCEVSLFQRERKQHSMPNTCCAVGYQNRIEILPKLSQMIWNLEKSQREVFCKKSVLQKFTKLSRICSCSVLFCISFKITCKRKEFYYCCLSSTSNSTKKNEHRHSYFSKILTPQVELSFFVQHGQRQWLLLKRYIYTLLSMWTSTVLALT